jgi:hypothetical protein
MVDTDTFLATLYVVVDDFCKSQLPPQTRQGPETSLSRSEVMTLAVFGQWSHLSTRKSWSPGRIPTGAYLLPLSQPR